MSTHTSCGAHTSTYASLRAHTSTHMSACMCVFCPGTLPPRVMPISEGHFLMLGPSVQGLLRGTAEPLWQNTSVSCFPPPHAVLWQHHRFPLNFMTSSPHLHSFVLDRHLSPHFQSYWFPQPSYSIEMLMRQRRSSASLKLCIAQEEFSDVWIWCVRQGVQVSINTDPKTPVSTLSSFTADLPYSMAWFICLKYLGQTIYLIA